MTASSTDALAGYEALWAKVPKTRPVNADGECLGTNPLVRSQWCWCPGGLDLDETAALALCRSAAITELLKNRALRLFPSNTVRVRVLDDEPIQGESEVSRREGWAEFYGPTLDHALQAAVRAVRGE